MTKPDIEDLKRHGGVLSLYSNRVRLKREGQEFIGLCPFHSEGTPSFRISNHQGVLVFKCFGCGESGDVIKFVQKTDGLNFKDAVQKIKDQLGHSFSETKVANKTFSSLSEQKPAITYGLEDYKKYEDSLAVSQEGQNWLKSRGINYETAKRLHVGFRETIKGSALKNWICFPSIIGDRILSIKYRNTGEKTFFKQPGMCKGEQTPLFNAEAVEPLEPIYLVEGECFLGDTEVLTPEGWVRLDQYNGQKVVQYNDDGTAEYVTPSAYINKQYSGNLIRVVTESKSVNLCTTENHRTLFYNIKTKQSEVRLTKDVPFSNASLFRTAILKCNGIELSDLEIRLQVAIQADASMESLAEYKHGHKSNGNDGWKAEFKKTRKIERLEWLLSELKLPYTKYPLNINRGTVIFRFQTKPGMFKKIFPTTFYSMNEHQRMVFLDELSHWDGHYYPNKGIKYNSVVESNADLVSTVFSVSGLAARKFLEPRVSPKSNLYGVQWNKRQKRGCQELAVCNQAVRETVQYSGLVYCVTVPSSFILVRTGGTVYVSGNCDAAIMEQAGFHSASIQSSSTSLTAANKEKLLESDYIILAGDNDVTGNEFMSKLWSELQERVYKLTWPEGMKDANQTFLEFCKGDIPTFQKLIEELTAKAKANLMPGVSNLRETFKSAQRVNTQDSPFRWRWPWPAMDSMVTIMPGSVVYLTATNTGQGKSTLMMEASLYNARRGEVILNYSAELSDQEYAQIAVSHLLKKDRHQLTKEDYDKAYTLLAGSRYYIGRNNDLNRVMDVLDLLEAAIRRSGAGTVILDTIHFVTTNETDTIKAQENAMNRIKSMAQKYGVKWFNLGQPRKATQQFKGKATHVTDAKGSEMLISASDAAFAIHRNCAKVDDPNKPPKEPYEPLTQIFLQKGRSLGTGSAYTELIFNGDICTFFPVAKEELQVSKLFNGE